ncbi:MAG: SxtJ family membrane protein [Bacteroidales bacterium]|nr:SxtJ family membrane protein [Bacteroidales bacterium]
MTLKYSNISVKQSIETAIVFAIIAILSYYIWQTEIGIWIGFALLVLSLIMPKVLIPVAWIWLNFSKILGSISSNLILTVIFFLIITPIGSLRRMFSKDTLKLKCFKKNKFSAYKERSHVYSSSDIKHPF